MELLVEIGLRTWEFFVDSSLWLILGFIAAGLLHGFVSTEFVTNHLGKGRFAPVFKAALIGVPLPLCSCGVLPAAMGLRGKGATKGATVSFLVSTPETGMDSIAVTWALMGPFMAVARPIAAGVSGIVAGLFESLFDKRRREGVRLEVVGETEGINGLQPRGIGGKLARGLGYAFGDLLRDLTPWLFVGLVLGGAISAVVPEGWINPEIGSGWVAKFAMLALGIPMYVCATASTPIAAALVLKGLSPGAAFVFLLTGPATNSASVVAMVRMLGIWTTVRFLFSVAAGALLFGWLVDIAYSSMGGAGSVQAGSGAETEAVWLGTAGAAVLLLLIARAYLSKKKCAEGCCR